MTTAQLVPKKPRRKRQPSAEMMREQLRLATDEIIAARFHAEFERGLRESADKHVADLQRIIDPDLDKLTYTGPVWYVPDQPTPPPWPAAVDSPRPLWHRLWHRIAARIRKDA